jgi:hypothetical protein
MRIANTCQIVLRKKTLLIAVNSNANEKGVVSHMINVLHQATLSCKLSSFQRNKVHLWIRSQNDDRKLKSVMTKILSYNSKRLRVLCTHITTQKKKKKKKNLLRLEKNSNLQFDQLPSSTLSSPPFLPPESHNYLTKRNDQQTDFLFFSYMAFVAIAIEQFSPFAKNHL